MYVVCQFISGSRLRACISTLAIALGTMCLPYATVFFGHQLAASLLFCAFFITFQLKFGTSGVRPVLPFLIGLLLGLAAITEYTTAMIVLVLAIYSLGVLRQKDSAGAAKTVAVSILGGLIPIALLLVYNAVCFGNPFTIGYANESDPYFYTSMRRGLMGISLPRPSVFYYLTLHPAQGLLWQSPVLLMSLVGLYFMLRGRTYRMEAVVVSLASISLLLINSGYYMWWGGYAAGPRFLIPMLPFLCLPIALIPRRLFAGVVVLGLVSVFQMIVVAASTVQVPDDSMKRISQLGFFQYSSIYSYCWRQLLAGSFTWNIGQQLFGLKGWTSLSPLILAATGFGVVFSRVKNTPQAASQPVRRP